MFVCIQPTNFNNKYKTHRTFFFLPMLQRKINTFEQECLLDENTENNHEIKERRVILKEFIHGFFIKGINYQEEIDSIKYSPIYERYHQALKEYNILTLGTEVLLAFYDWLLIKTNKTFISKMRGLLMCGDSIFGKALWWRIFFRLFTILELSTSKTQSFTLDKKIYKYFHFIFVDEFDPGIFQSNNNISQNSWNNLFDWY